MLLEKIPRLLFENKSEKGWEQLASIISTMSLSISLMRYYFFIFFIFLCSEKLGTSKLW